MMKHPFPTIFGFLLLALMVNCKQEEAAQSVNTLSKDKIAVIIDTDANNELDDQHALAYLFFNRDIFDVKAVTVNSTFNGGNIDEHYAEAERVMKLCNVHQEIPLLKGANGDFEEISADLGSPDYDGYEAVDYIIEASRKATTTPLILLPVGKLTNIALALEKAPDIKDKIRIVWLGSNYPEKGEYNQENDIPSLNYILEQDVPFEMVMVRYGKSTGSDVVKATPSDMQKNMPGMGPKVVPIKGRNGGSFDNFGDYSIDLFSKIDLYGDPPGRALFDMVAVAILKNESWGDRKEIPAPILIEEEWQERPENMRKITIWENFDKVGIMEDFFSVMKNAK